jgi:arylsulfatase A-like enzyme
MNKHYVWAFDDNRSYYGEALDRIHSIIFECSSQKEACSIAIKASSLEGVRFINMYREKPACSPTRYYVEQITKDSNPEWYS